MNNKEGITKVFPGGDGLSRREFFQLTGAVAAGSGVLSGVNASGGPPEADQASSRKWFEKPLRVFDFALESDYAHLFDQWTPRSVLQLARRVNANVLDMMIISEWGYTYFKSSHLPLHPQLGSRDLLREVLEEARTAGLRVLGMWGPSPNPHLYRLHPDWAYRNEDNEISGWGFMHLDPCIHLCMTNSPYKDLIYETLEELFREYPIDGVAFDYPVAAPGAVCYCQYCRAAYLNETGIDLDKRAGWKEPDFRALRDWEVRKFEEFLIENRRIASARDRIIIMNKRWEPGNYEGVDVVFQEQHSGNLITLQDIGFEIRHTVAVARAHRKPVVHCYTYAHGYCVGLPKAPEHMRQETRVPIIHGASPWVVTWENECVQETRGWDHLGVVYKEASQLEEYLADVEPLSHIALLLSHQSSDAPGLEEYMHGDHVKGFYDALTRAHIPVDLIVDQDLNLEKLSRYKALILANARCLSQEQAHAIRTFVERGGGLVATYETSLFDERGRTRDAFLLGDLFGCQYAGSIERPWVWIDVSGKHPVVQGFDAGTRIPHGEMRSLEGELNSTYRAMRESDRRLRGITPQASRCLRVTRKDGFESPATLMDTVKELGDAWMRHLSAPYARRDMGYPALVAGNYSKGRVVYLPTQVDRLYYRIGHPDYGRFLLNSARWVAGQARIEIDAPGTVETTFYEQTGNRRFIIHLLNHSYDQLYPLPTNGRGGMSAVYSSGISRSVGKPLAVENITVRVRLGPGKRIEGVQSVLDQQGVTFAQKGEEVVFSVPRLEEYRVIAIQQS